MDKFYRKLLVARQGRWPTTSPTKRLTTSPTVSAPNTSGTAPIKEKPDTTKLSQRAAPRLSIVICPSTQV